MRLGTYGGFQLSRAGGLGRLPLRGKKIQALCAYLALIGGSAARESLRTLLWGDVDPRAGRHSLSQTLSQLRAQLGVVHPLPVVFSYDTVSLAPQLIKVDLNTVERLLRRNTPESLQLACRLSSGEFLAGMDLQEPAFADWVGAQRERARGLAFEAHWRCAMTALARGRNVNALLSALRLVEIDPLNEFGHLLLIALYADQGQVGAALRQYHAWAHLLDIALGRRPGAEMEELRLQLLVSPEGSFIRATDIAADLHRRRQGD